MANGNGNDSEETRLQQDRLVIMLFERMFNVKLRDNGEEAMYRMTYGCMLMLENN